MNNPPKQNMQRADMLFGFTRFNKQMRGYDQSIHM